MEKPVNETTSDHSLFLAVQKTTKKRRAFFFGTILLYIPVLLIAHAISPTQTTMGTVFALWVVILIFATVLVALSKCPRCGNYFHLHGVTLLVLRKCLHCQLHINATDTQ